MIRVEPELVCSTANFSLPGRKSSFIDNRYRELNVQPTASSLAVESVSDMFSNYSSISRMNGFWYEFS